MHVQDAFLGNTHFQYAFLMAPRFFQKYALYHRKMLICCFSASCRKCIFRWFCPNHDFHGIMHFYGSKKNSRIMHFTMEKCILFGFSAGCRKCIFRWNYACFMVQFSGVMHFTLGTCIFFAFRLAAEMHISLILSKSRLSWNYAFLMVPIVFGIMRFPMVKCIILEKPWNHQKCILKMRVAQKCILKMHIFACSFYGRSKMHTGFWQANFLDLHGLPKSGPVGMFSYLIFSVPFECHSASLARDSTAHVTLQFQLGTRCSILWKIKRKLMFAHYLSFIQA